MLNIEMSERIKKLRVINHFNFIGPFFNDKQKDADFSIGSVIREIITKYDYEIKHNYTFVVKYDKDIYSFLAYRIIYNAGSILQKNIDIKILGNINTPEEKEIFKGIPVIGYRKARKRITPSLTIVPARSLSPLFLPTGSGSPVIIDSSTYPSPSHTVPSTGTFSPILTSTTSRTATVESGTSTTSPSFTTCACRGTSPISERIAEAVDFFARSSSNRPVSTKVIIITDAS